MAMRALLLLPVGAAALVVIACATATPGANPHDMSAASHEQQAGAHAQQGEEHNAQFRPGQAVERQRCAPGRALPGAGTSVAEDVCWSSVHNPTATHLWDAAEHRRHAADHRAASAALREAEARACAGVAEADRDMSPFEHREDVVSVAPLALPEADARARTPAERQLGAVVKFRAVPGLTAEWLQRIVDCHLARNAALGHVVPEMPDCPLVPRDVAARVLPAGDGFAVEVRAADPSGAREVLSRAQRLTPQPPGRSVKQ